MTQNSPYSQGLCPHMDVQPENPTPTGWTFCGTL